MRVTSLFTRRFPSHLAYQHGVRRFLSSAVPSTLSSSSPPSTSSSPPPSAGVSSLVSWIESHGGTCSKLYLKQSDVAGRTVHCRIEISADERIVRIPRRLLISATDCKQSEVGRHFDQAGKPFTNSQSYIAAFILQERQKGESSFHHPFLSSLPTSFSSFPLLYTDTQLSLLRGSMVLDLVEAQRSDVHSDYLALMCAAPAFSFSLDDFYNARLAVASRVFGARLSDDAAAAADSESEAVLVPYVDLLNHGEQHNIHWSYEPSLQQFTCRALLPIEPAAEVLTTYGSRCNSQLLSHYGFALQHNDNNECAMQFGLHPPHSSRETEQLRMKKVRVLDGLDGELSEHIKWRVGRGSSDELRRLLSYLRLCEADEADMWGVDDGSDGTQRAKVLPVLSGDNERRVWRSVAVEARRRVSEFPVGLSEYQSRISKSRVGTVERFCAATCAGELNVLDWFVGFADVCVEALDGKMSSSDAEVALGRFEMSFYWSSLRPLMAHTSRRQHSPASRVHSYS